MWQPCEADWYYVRAMHLPPRQAAFAALVLIALGMSIAGCSPVSSGGDTSGSGSLTATAPADPDALPLHVSKVVVRGDERAVLRTSKGVIEIAFYPGKAPNTVASFIELAGEGFFDGTKFHRVEPGLLIQGGDPLSRTDDPAVGTGGPSWRLKAEFNDLKHVEGTVAMARTQSPDSAGSQFYIGLVPMSGLDGNYTVFGRVVKGMSVVRAISVGDVISKVTIVHGS